MSVGDLDEEQLDALLQHVDEEKINQALSKAISRYVVPRLEEVQAQAQEYPDRMEVRRRLEAMSPEERTQKFNEVVMDLAKVAYKIRQQPTEGMAELKRRLRDPWTMESLLLIFTDEEHIDDEYSAKVKEFSTNHVRHIAMALLPEMYSEEEREAFIQEAFGGDVPDHVRDK